MDVGPMHPDLAQYVYDDDLVLFWEFRGGHQNSQDCLLDLTRRGHGGVLVGGSNIVTGRGLRVVGPGTQLCGTSDSPDFANADAYSGFVYVEHVAHPTVSLRGELMCQASGACGAVPGVSDSAFRFECNNAGRILHVSCNGIVNNSVNSNIFLNPGDITIVGFVRKPDGIRFFQDAAFINMAAQATIEQNSTFDFNTGNLDGAGNFYQYDGYIRTLGYFNRSLSDNEMIRAMQCVLLTGNHPYSWWAEQQAGRKRRIR